MEGVKSVLLILLEALAFVAVVVIVTSCLHSCALFLSLHHLLLTLCRLLRETEGYQVWQNRRRPMFPATTLVDKYSDVHTLTFWLDLTVWEVGEAAGGRGSV